MIAHLTGTVLEITNNSIVLDVHGVGYEVFATQTLLKTLVKNNTASFTIATIVKQDSIELFGFADFEEKRVFNLLLGVSGVGPKSALAIIGYGVNSITQAIARADVTFFTAIPRIGKKNAQKIIIELKSKLGDINDLDLSQEDDDKNQELIEALVAMGFVKNQVMEVVKNEINSEDTIEVSIRKALRILGKKR